MLLIGSSNQPDSFSAKFRWVGWVCSWQCSPFRALFSVLNSPRNRCKSMTVLAIESIQANKGEKADETGNRARREGPQFSRSESYRAHRRVLRVRRGVVRGGL